MKTQTKVVGGSVGVIAAAIIAAVLGVEGGYSDHKSDPGGKTNHGITEQVARSHGYTGDMKDLSKDAAQSIYFEDYIKAPGYDKIIDLSPAVAEKLVDAGVNAGPGRSSRWFQESLNTLNRGGKDYPAISADGKVGPGTINAYKALVKVRGNVRACELIIKSVDARQYAHYASLTKLTDFTVGWVDHRIGNVPLTKCKDYGVKFNVPEQDR